MKTSKILNHLSFITIGITWLLIIGSFYYFLFYMNPPLEITNPPVVDKQSYHAGDDLIYTLSCCKHTDLPVTLLRSWRDGISVSEPAKTITGGVKGCYTRSYLVTIPRLYPGKYKIHFVFSYKLGPFLERSVKTISNSFDIVE